MFTGLITGIGTVRRCTKQQSGLELTIESSYPDLEPGESIAVDGACLTVRNLRDGTFTVQIVGPSLARTRFENYAVGQRVNLERALRIGDRLGGHLVQGHVDGIGTVERLDLRPDARLLDIQVPAEVDRVSVPLGSITVDGVSLTVNAKPKPSVVQISLIPFTLEHTTLSDRRAGDQVHLEADTIGKYVRTLMESVNEKSKE
jgi:riboflavin synthase